MKVLGTGIEGGVIVELTRSEAQKVLDTVLPDDEEMGYARPTMRDLLILAVNASSIAEMTFDEITKAVLEAAVR